MPPLGIAIGSSTNIQDVVYLSLDYKASFKALSAKIDAYNASIKNDDPENYKKRCLKSTHLFTAQVLLKMYGSYLSHQKRVSIVEDNPFTTNNKAIATKRGAGFYKNTSWAHITRLLQAGIITKKVFHGTRKGYELELNNEVLIASPNANYNRLLVQKYCQQMNVKPEKISEEVLAKISLEIPDFSASLQGRLILKCEHIETGTLQEHNYNTQKGVVNLAFWLRANFNSSADGQMNNDLLIKGQEHTSKSENWLSLNFGGSTKQEQIPPAPLAKKPSKDNGIASLVDIAWSFAKSVLWRNESLKDWDIQEAQRHITYWFNEHLNRTDRTQGVLLKRFFERIQLSKRYISKEPDRFVPNPRIYFDSEFQHGFIGTKDWVWKNQITKKEFEELNINLTSLRKALRHYYKDCNTDSFLRSEAYISKLKNPDILNAFYKCIVDRKFFTHEHFEKIKQQKSNNNKNYAN